MIKRRYRISFTSKLLLSVSGLILMASCFLPIWNIQLSAPQYPDGLNLLIYSFKLEGDLDVINGLNHYIGMRPLHQKDFGEFIVLPYIIAFFALSCTLVALLSNKRGLYLLLTGFLFFGIIAMVDFWHWEYNYGHNLNPEAAIIVPGMSYQPPLIGYKKLLNFGAYSIPATGGWLFVISGLLIGAAAIIEVIKSKRYKKLKSIRLIRRGAEVSEKLQDIKKEQSIPVITFLLLVFLYSCGSSQPDPIKLNVDHCEFCKMTISDSRFATELITPKGRIYKFDDVKCMLNYKAENKNIKFKSEFVADYLSPHILIPVKNAFFIKGGQIESPMGGAVTCFSNKDSAEVYSKNLSATKTDWLQLSKSM